MKLTRKPWRLAAHAASILRPGAIEQAVQRRTLRTTGLKVKPTPVPSSPPSSP